MSIRAHGRRVGGRSAMHLRASAQEIEQAYDKSPRHVFAKVATHDKENAESPGDLQKWGILN